MTTPTNAIALPLRGGCLCGACRYELRAAPLMLYVCHCTDCQRQSGSAFGMSMPAPRAAFVFTHGEPARFERTMPSGRKSTIRFCGTCASRLCAESSGDVVTVRPGTLDDTSWLQPASQHFTRSALTWACFDELPCYTTQPESWAEVAELWKAKGIRFATP